MRHDYKENGSAVWVDLHDPTEEEIAGACTDCRLRIPTRAELESIESSSRLRCEGQTLIMSLPITPYQPNVEPVSAPMGFVLTPNLLVTVRFDELHAVHKVGQAIEGDSETHTPPEIFAMIAESIIEHGADKLEHLQTDTRALSRDTFHRAPRRRNVARSAALLRETLVKLGDIGERLSELRETLLALQRLLPFVVDRGGKWIGDDVTARLRTGTGDIQSLNDFETHLTDKVQFLLDATLGFINNEQNDMFKVLTIASVVGIPPVFIAGVYGMNFHDMPELSWPHGYAFGWAAIVVSTLVPIAWFKWRGWW